MSGPPVDLFEEMKMLKEIADTGLSGRPILRDAPKVNESVSLSVLIKEITAQQYVRKFSTLGESDIDSGMEYRLEGTSGECKVTITVSRESEKEIQKILHQEGKRGIGWCEVIPVVEKHDGQRIEIEIQICLDETSFNDLQGVLGVQYRDEEFTLSIEVGISIPSDEYIDSGNVLWVERYLLSKKVRR